MRKWIRNLKEGDMFDATPCAKQLLDFEGGFGKDSHADSIAIAAENLYFECEEVVSIWENDELVGYVVYAYPHNLCGIKDCLVEIMEEE